MFSDWMTARGDAGGLLASGHLVEARKRLDSYLETHSNDSTIAVIAADIAFRRGDNVAAYSAIAPFVTVSSSPEVLLRASLAAARLGEVYPGQKEYCANLVIFYCGAWKEEVARALPTGDETKDLEKLSLLGLAVYGNSDDADERLFYARQELALDRGNPVAATIAWQFLMGAGKYREAASAMKDAMPRATGGMAYWVKREYDDAVSAVESQKKH